MPTWTPPLRRPVARRVVLAAALAAGLGVAVLSAMRSCGRRCSADYFVTYMRSALIWPASGEFTLLYLVNPRGSRVALDEELVFGHERDRRHNVALAEECDQGGGDAPRVASGYAPPMPRSIASCAAGIYRKTDPLRPSPRRRSGPRSFSSSAGSLGPGHMASWDARWARDRYPTLGHASTDAASRDRPRRRAPLPPPLALGRWR